MRDRAPKVHGTPWALRTARRDRRLEAQEPLRGDDVLVRSQTHSPMAFAATRVEVRESQLKGSLYHVIFDYDKEGFLSAW